MLELSEASVHHMFVNARAAVRVRRCGKKIASPDGAVWGRGCAVRTAAQAVASPAPRGWTPVTPSSMLPAPSGWIERLLYRMQAEAAQYADQATRLGARSAIDAPSAISQMPESLSQFMKSFARTF